MHEMKNELCLQKNLFFVSLISSILMCLSSNSFMSMWMSMEVNLFSMVPMVSMNQKYFSEKSCMIYFLIQSISSSMILMGLTMKTFNIENLINLIIFLSICMKLGMFPFHFWMMSTLEGMLWNTLFLILTIQKIIPMIILNFFYKYNMMILVCLTNMFIAAMSGISMFSLRKILGFSSINHLSIMMITMILSKKLLKIYFFTYSIMTLSATKSLKMMNLNFISQTFKIMKFNKTNNLIFLLIFLSMAGIPPFIGFLPKMMTVIMMLKSNMILTTLILLLLNTLSSYFYLRLSMNNLLMNLNMKKTKTKKQKNTIPIYLTFSPLIILMMWNFKLKKLLIFKIKIKMN